MLQVEEVRRHSHCLAFSSAGPQSQTYYISYDSYTEHLRWHRTASKVLKVSYIQYIFVSTLTLLPYWFTLYHDGEDFAHLYCLWWTCCDKLLITLSCPPFLLCQIASQRVNSVDLSCCSLEELPAQLFYSHDLTHLNLKNNFISLHKGVPALTRWACYQHSCSHYTESGSTTILCV